MDIEKHVVSLELSRKLKELGVPQESYFAWTQGKYKWELADIGMHNNIPDWSKFEQLCVSAFLASELGEMLPIGLDTNSHTRLEARCGTHKTANGQWQATVFGSSGNTVIATTGSEPDARAKLLIHLIEQGIVKMEKKT